VRVDHDDLATWLFDLEELAVRDRSLQGSTELINRSLDYRLRSIA
jgi:hypothetical protein